jgi:ATP adenylyltransferase
MEGSPWPFHRRLFHPDKLPVMARPSGNDPALHAPWRSEYIDNLDAAEKQSGPPKDSSGSFLRDYWLSPAQDTANHIIARTGVGMILLNKYPYAGGHLLVALGEPRARLLEYSPQQRADLWALSDLATDLMERTLEPQGINIGINQGRAAGAGLPQHIHIHLIPRWGGDVNFMATVGGVRIISASLDKMAQRYREAWQRMQAAPGH